MMGRLATTLTEQQRSEVETLAAVLTAEQMADYFGMGRTTFFSLMQRDAEIAARYKKGRARAVGSVAQSLITKARAGDTACMIFFLKTQGGWRETTRIEHLDNAAGQMIDITALSDAELEAVITALSLTAEGDQAPGLPHPSRSA
jgi:hypothetical protein